MTDACTTRTPELPGPEWSNLWRAAVYAMVRSRAGRDHRKCRRGLAVLAPRTELCVRSHKRFDVAAWSDVSEAAGRVAAAAAGARSVHPPGQFHNLTGTHR